MDNNRKLMFTKTNQNARNLIYWIVKIFIPNLLFAVYVLGLLSYAENIKNSTLYLLLAGMGVYFFSRLYFYYYRVGFFLWKNLKNLRQIINEFKKGKFVLSDTDIQSMIIFPRCSENFSRLENSSIQLYHHRAMN
jgi:hypothetical protein